MRTIVLRIERKRADMFAEQGGIKYLGIVRPEATARLPRYLNPLSFR